MLTKSFLLFALTGATFASPQPQQSLGDIAGSLTSLLGSVVPTDINLGDVSSELNVASSLLGALSDLPTLPASIESVLATAIPVSDLTRSDFACNPTAADWYKNLPNDVKSALSSYGSAVQTWASEHISDLASYTGVNIPVCTGAAAGGSGKSASTTASSGSKTTSAAAGAGASASGSGTAAGGAASTTTSKGAAPHVTGAIMGSLGFVGALGVLAML